MGVEGEILAAEEGQGKGQSFHVQYLFFFFFVTLEFNVGIVVMSFPGFRARS